jgi:rubrerythrin
MSLEESISFLVAHCRAGEQGYRRASQLMFIEPELAHFFEEQAEARGRAAQALEHRLQAAGRKLIAQPLIQPPSEGWSWPAAQDETPEAVIESCHRGEERALRAYEQAMAEVPDDWRWELNSQYQSIRSARAKLHSWLSGRESQPQRS